MNLVLLQLLQLLARQPRRHSLARHYGINGVLQLAQKRATCVLAIPQHGQITTATLRSLVTTAVILLVDEPCPVPLEESAREDRLAPDAEFNAEDRLVSL